MSRAQTSLDTWVTEPTGGETRTRPQIDWDALEPAVRRLTKHEQLLGVSVLREERRKRTTGVVDDTVSQDVHRAMQDGHDYSDCGGDQQ